MSHLLAVSPHLDDAAFSIGGTLAAHARGGGRVTIVTCFTGNVEGPAGFALACQLDKGLSPDIDYMALRRDEDRRACAVIGAEPLHLPFLEAPHRGYGDAAALFGPRLRDDAVASPLAKALAATIAWLGPDLVAGPSAIGGHVDHVVVRDVLAELVEDVLWWEDWPYADRAVIATDGQPLAATPIDAVLGAARQAMCLAYESQLGFQFGGAAALAGRLSAMGIERLHARPAVAATPA